MAAVHHDHQTEVIVRPPTNMKRRGAVSSEPMNALAVHPPVHRVLAPKSKEELARLEKALHGHMMFSHLEGDEYTELFNHMFPCHFKQGELIIKQGDQGDNFYVVEDGQCDIFVAKPGDTRQYGQLVVSVGPGGTFGELALMYGSPRAATVVAKTEVKLWAIDRDTFRHTLMSVTLKKRAQYESFLEKVAILAPCTKYEKLMIADALDSITFKDGEYIVRQGEPGDRFYIIVDGKVSVTKQQGDQTVKVNELTPGGYFGERALLTNQPRAANVIAMGNVKCVQLGREKFTRLLGPCEDILRRNLDTYNSVIGSSQST